MRRQFGLKTNAQSLHMIFTGNPGTGKTTTARLIGEAFAEMGLLECHKDEVPFVEISHADILDCHFGESDKRLKAAFKKAEGVLTILNVNSLWFQQEYRNVEKITLQKIIAEAQQRLFELEIKEIASKY